MIGNLLPNKISTYQNDKENNMTRKTVTEPTCSETFKNFEKDFYL